MVTLFAQLIRLAQSCFVRRGFAHVAHFVETARDVFIEANRIARSTNERLSRVAQD